MTGLDKIPRRPLTIGVLAHVDAGKTTLTEQMLFQAGAVRSLGRVDDGSAHTDFTEFERRRGISVRAASAFLSWNGAKIYVIDTPGHSDFSGETERAARAMDFAVVAVSAVEGVQAQTEVIWRALSKMGIPALFFINKTDREGADVDSVLAELAELIFLHCLPQASFAVARTVVSTTPVVLARHYKPRQGSFRQWLEAEIRRCCAEQGLPEPLSVEPLPCLPVRDGAPLPWNSFIRQRKGQPPRHGYGFRLHFATPVPVPFAIGSLAHFGLGLFVAERPEA